MFVISRLKYLLILIFIIVGVAFFTLLERKILGFTQSRTGPAKVGVIGVLQPVADAVKLFSKEQVWLHFSNFLLYLVCPIFSLIISLLGWRVLWFEGGVIRVIWRGVLFMCILRVGVYTGVGAGWRASSKYAILGTLRLIAQTISYEVRLAISFLSLLIFSGRVRFKELNEVRSSFTFFLLLFPLALVWFTSSLAEVNRTPFDFGEGESELVSGFNTEYAGGRFALFFLAEYRRILFIRFVISYIFIGGSSDVIFFLKVTFVGYLFVLIRTTLPRFRYDKLIGLAWKSLLRVSLFYFLFCYGVVVSLI